MQTPKSQTTRDLGWRGKTVRHADGRTGKIESEYLGFCHASLTIAVDGGGRAMVQLNTNGKDTGEAGWEWWCANFHPSARYIPVGDANG